MRLATSCSYRESLTIDHSDDFIINNIASFDEVIWEIGSSLGCSVAAMARGPFIL